MNTKTLSLLAMLAAVPLLTHCAAQDDVAKLNYQVRLVNKKVEDMKSNTVTQMQQNQAASVSQLDEMQHDILALQSRVDELERFNQMLKEQNQQFETSLTAYSSKMQEDLQREKQNFTIQQQKKDQKIQELENQLARNQKSLQAIQQSRVEDARRKAEAAAKAAEAAKQRAASASSGISGTSLQYIRADKTKKRNAISLPSSQPVTSGTAYQGKPSEERPSTAAAGSSSGSSTPVLQDSLATAKTAFDSGNYQKAHDLYNKIYKADPKGRNAAEAVYMMGECLYSQNNYNPAVIEYQKVLNDYPSSSRSAAALLKQAMSFQNLSDNKTAAVLYRTLITTYPETTEAQQGKDLLKALPQ